MVVYQRRSYTKMLFLHDLSSLVVLSLMDLHRVSRVSRQLRRFASHPEEALVWVSDF